MPDSPDEQQQRNSSQLVNWPTTTQAPPAPEESAVLLLFHGLFCFCQNGPVCEVGVVNKAPDHEFSVFVLELDSLGTPVFPPLYLGGASGEPIRLRVEGFVGPSVSFFQSASADERNWEHVPDFEGPDFYDTKLDKKKGVFDPIITIENGLFYTAEATDYEFKRDDEAGDSRDIGPTAHDVGVDVSHGEDEHVLLTIGGKELKLEANDGRRYEIYFSNACPREKDKCKFDAHSSVKEKRNDFHFYYKTFDIPGGKKEYMVKLKGPRRDAVAAARKSAAPSSLTASLLNLLNERGLLSTHEAPCGSSGFGRGGGLGG